MLITDGAVEDYEPVFEKYNWPDRKVTLLVEVKGAGEETKGSVFLLPAWDNQWCPEKTGLP